MTNKISTRKLYLPIVLFFIIINGALILSGPRLQNAGFGTSVALGGNIILFAATFLSLFLYQRAMTHASTHGFLRNAYSGLLVKLVVCLVSVGIYAVAAKGAVDKYGIFACVFFYIIYSIIEMRSLMRWNKERTNA